MVGGWYRGNKANFPLIPGKSKDVFADAVKVKVWNQHYEVLEDREGAEAGGRLFLNCLSDHHNKFLGLLK